MKTVVGKVEKTTLGFSTTAEHEGYIIREFVKPDRKHHSYTLVSINGGYPKEFQMFENQICSIIGEQDGLVIRAKMVQTFIDNKEETWSV